MKINHFIIMIVLLFICINLSGCNENNEKLSNEEQRFVGTWQMEEMKTTITFYSNRDISDFFGDKFEVKDGKFIILTEYAGGDEQQVYDYNFYENDTRLVLINVDNQIIHHLIKQ